MPPPVGHQQPIPLHSTLLYSTNNDVIDYHSTQVRHGYSSSRQVGVINTAHRCATATPHPDRRD